MQKLNLQFIKTRRIQLDKTLQETAECLGMKNASTYMKYENGIYAFKADHLPLLARTLNCMITDFFTSDVAETAI
ncbi:helix-turn-helix domain-containing protein [Lederbergia galactosidilytica]|uniref:DNA-binding protein n=1 Tax=Lederbergia galactosidilytica TaxID=217031 RepID=A0A178A0N4_9BACI|nr:helix-turn-helix transcriptional regulator [Lederbergia galactosidilytica]OAK72658.1 DNA-binding protein [Lederbergia galactosidilytica]